MVTRGDDPFSSEHLLNAIVVSSVVALALVIAPTWVAVIVLVVVAFLCARLGGRDGGLGSVAAGTFMYIFAITEPHFRLRLEHEGDVVLLLVLFVASNVAAEVGVRLRRRHLSRAREAR
jgi:K+-sensing histidine kinase KdpD